MNILLYLQTIFNITPKDIILHLFLNLIKILDPPLQYILLHTTHNITHHSIEYLKDQSSIDILYIITA